MHTSIQAQICLLFLETNLSPNMKLHLINMKTITFGKISLQVSFKFHSWRVLDSIQHSLHVKIDKYYFKLELAQDSFMPTQLYSFMFNKEVLKKKAGFSYFSDLWFTRNIFKTACSSHTNPHQSFIRPQLLIFWRQVPLT